MKQIILFIGILISGIASAASVIANKDVKLSDSEVNEVFTGEKMSAGGVRLVVVDNKSAMESFCSKVLKMDAAKYTALWAKKSFRDGIPSPKGKTSDTEVIDFVKSTSGAVGYIGGSAPAGVTEVSKF